MPRAFAPPNVSSGDIHNSNPPPPTIELSKKKKKNLLIEDMRNIRIDEKPLCLWLFQFMRKQLG